MRYLKKKDLREISRVSDATMNQKIKRDAGKPRMDLIPPEAMFALGAVLTYGADKYPAGSWRTVEPERYTAALLRHMVSWMAGERRDPESGMPHLWHVLTNAAFLTALENAESVR